MTQKAKEIEEPPYFSPRELATRWRCSRSSVDRIAEDAGFTRFLPRNGANGMVRYVRKEVEAYEQSRRVAMTKRR